MTLYKYIIINLFNIKKYINFFILSNNNEYSKKKYYKKPIIKRNTNKSNAELVNLLLDLLIIIKIYHWKTKSYSEHKATDELYSSLNKNIDKFVEVLLGKNDNRLKMKGHSIIINDPSSKKELQKIIYEYRILLENKIKNYILEKDTDLLNIRDEILGDLNQFLYLITLK